MGGDSANNSSSHLRRTDSPRHNQLHPFIPSTGILNNKDLPSDLRQIYGKIQAKRPSKNAPRIFLRDLRKDVFVRFKSSHKSYDKFRINGKDDLD